MCGLVGMVGMLEYKHKQAMKDLLFLNSLRGKDSTGLTCVNRDRYVTTRKMTVPSYEFLEYPQVERAMKHADQLWIGHSRYKTTGDVSKANAHPFEILDEDGDITLIGAHNGTLQNKFEIEKKLGDKYETDSEALFNLFVEAPTYKDAIKGLRGAWSLVWWDPTKNNLHFCRNNERPMTYAYTKDRKVIVWASEAWMIINACRRNGVELLVNDKGLSCYATNENSLYTLTIPQEKDQELPDLVKEGGYVGLPADNFQKGWNRWQSWWDDDAKEEEEKRAAREKAAQTNGQKDDKTVVTIGYPPQQGVRGYNGVNLSRKQFFDIKAKGCAWCHEKLDDRIITAFVSEDSVVCVKCMRDTHPKEGGRLHLRDGEFPDSDPDFDPDLDDDEFFDPQPETKEYRKLIQQSTPAVQQKATR